MYVTRIESNKTCWSSLGLQVAGGDQEGDDYDEDEASDEDYEEDDAGENGDEDEGSVIP
jgi:hypothetical protein